MIILLLSIAGVVTYVFVRMSEAKTKKDREDRNENNII